MSASKNRLPVVLALSAAVLVACGDSGGSSSGGGGAVVGTSVEGVAVKGPLVNATVKAYAVDYSASDLIGAAAPVDTGTTNSRAQITGIALDPAGAPYIVVVEADADTTDLTTGAAPVITRMKTIITADMLNNSTPVVATPLTSMAVEVAASKSPTPATLAQSLTAAQNTVKSTLGFGLEESVDLFTASPVLTDDADTPEEQAQVAAYRLAVEAVSAVLNNAAADSTELNDSATDVLSALALDLSDGKIDGMNGATSLPQLSGVDVSAETVANLTIPGTTTPVSSIITVLDNEAASLGTSVTVDASVTVTPQEVATVADTDYDGVADDIDNCVNVKNGANEDNQLDANANGVGAACEAAPGISAVSASGAEDGGDIIVALAGTDAEGDTLTFTVDGVALTPGESSYTYSPAPDFSGQVVLPYSVSDGESSSAASTITITVAAVNDAPAGSLSIIGAAEEGEVLSLDNQLSDADGPLTVVSYQWLADGVAITGATEATFTLRQAQVGKSVRADIVVSDGVFPNTTVSSNSTAAVANTINNPSTGDVVILGTPTEGQTLTFSNTLSDPDGPVAETGYQWLADGAPIAGATSASLLLTQEQVGKAISLMLAYTDGTFADSFTSDATNPVANVNNAATGSVTISGTATEDETLQADTGAIADEDGLTGVTYSYQWLADGLEIDGATGSQLTLDDSHVGQAISVQVGFTDDLGGNESLTSLPTAAVANVNDPVQGSVTISGTAMDTQQLSVVNFLAGLTDDDGLPATPPAETTYQWKRDGVDIAGATQATYTLVTADVGAVITVQIQFPDNRGTTETVLSNGTAAVAAFNNMPTGSVVISGDTQNQTWTVTNDLADADGPATLVISYQWYADGAPIGGATTDNFTPDQSYVGASIFVRASYTDDDSNFTEVDSDAVVVIDADDAYTGGVSISGTAEEDQTLTAINDLADVDGAIVIESYQWKADGVNINGANADTLLLGQEQVGAAITVDVTFNDGVFGSQTATSAATAAVANVNDAPQGSVTFSGAAAPGNDLTASDTLSDEDGMGMVIYEWFVDGVTTSVLGATYSVQPEDVGLDVFVRASYVDGQGTSESVDSASVTVQSVVQSYSFNPASFSGQSVYDVYVDDDSDSECVGTNTFVRFDLGAGGDFSAAVACDDTVVTGTWALEQNDEVLVLNSPLFDDTNFVVANGDVLDNKQAYCWIETAAVTDSATALDICRQGVSPDIGTGSFYYSQADVHADTFDAKRLSHTWLAGRTLYDVWFGNVDTDGDCEINTQDAAGLTQLVISADGLTVDVTGVAGDQCDELAIPIEISPEGMLGDSVSGGVVNYLGSNDQYLEMVFRNEDGSPDNVDRFYHDLTEAQAAYDAIAVFNGGSFTYTQNFLDSQLAKSPVYNVHQSGGQWYVEKIEFDGAGYAELTERAADDLRFSDPGAFYTPQGTAYAVSSSNISLASISQGEIYWHISEDPNIGAGYVTPNSNGLEVCWWDGAGSPCDNSFEWFFFSEEAAQRYIDGLNEVDNELVGSWLIDDGPGARNVLTFIDNSRYVVFHEATNPDQTAGSAEYGNYTWDGFNFTSAVIAESDDQGGLGNSAFTIEVFGNDLHLDGSPIGTRIADGNNPIVGPWIIGSGDDITVVTMLSTSEYAIVHTQNAECYTGSCPAQALSGEFGFYNWDGFNFTATSVSVDTDGPGGLYNAEDSSDQLNETLEIMGAQLTFTDFDEGPFVLDRVGVPVVSLVCGYESGWDDMLDQPLIFNSIDDYNTVVSDCDMQNGPLPTWSKADLAGMTLYDGSGEVTFDGTADTAVFTDYGVDEVKNTGDDETFYVVVSDYDTDQVKLEYSSSLGGPAEGFDLLTLLSFDGTNYHFAVFYEEYAWAQSDGDDLDTANKDGEIWYWDFTTEAPVLFACATGDGNEGEFINSFIDYQAAVTSCSVNPRAITSSDLVGKVWNSDGETLVFNANNTAVLNGFENFTWSLDGDYLVMWNEFNTFYDVYAIVDEAVNGSGNTVISVKVYNEDTSFGDGVRETGADGDIWSAVVTITDQPLDCGYESGWDDINERPLVFNSVNDYYEVRSSCASQNGTFSFSTSSLAGLTFYEEGNETRFVFDGTGTSGVATDAGVDGILDTGDDETFYVTASSFDTNVVQLEGSLTPGGAVVISELWSLEYYNANELGDGKDYWVITIFSEDYSWPESDGSVNIDGNDDGEIWHNNVSTASDFNWAGLWP